MIKYTTGFVDKLEDILEESNYRIRYERGNFQSGWCLLDHKRVVVLNKFLNTEGRVNTLVELIPQLKIDYDKLTLNSQKLFDFLTENRLQKLGIEITAEDKTAQPPTQETSELADTDQAAGETAEAPAQDGNEKDGNEKDGNEKGGEKDGA